MKRYPSDPTSTYIMQPQSYLCFVCSAPAPFGIGYGGIASEIPEHRRGRMWVCSEHVKIAEQRRDAARLSDSPFARVG